MVLAHNIQESHRTEDVRISADVSFDTMLLTSNTLEGLSKSGFLKPSPIQLHGIPLGKCGFDILLEAKSGTGKTAVFTVIGLEKLDLDKGLQVIVLAPTREIAAQISDVIKQIGSGYHSLSVEVVMGGLPIQDDIAKFKKNTHIVVGSPGRLRHLIQDKHMDVSAVRLLVLDEADKLMDKSFQADVNYIFSILPKQKQVIMSSATYPEPLKSIINKYVHNAQHICPDSTSILLGITQLFTVVKRNSNIVRQTEYRFQELLNVLSKKQFKQCLIFCNYQVRVGELCKMLTQEKWPAEQLHGQQDQTDRLEALKTLQEYKCRILISTDLAARGIDASNVDLVINFEPPFEWQTYLHRIGRAGRFGSYGVAITILSEGQEELKFKKMLELINVSLNLQNLWDDKKFLIENNSAIEEKNRNTLKPFEDHCAENNSKSIDLWEALTPKNDISEEVCSFDELNSSYNSEDNQVQSFKNLLTSFDCHVTSDENSIYKHFQFHKISNCESVLNILSNTEPRYDLEKLSEANKSINSINTVLLNSESDIRYIKKHDHIDICEKQNAENINADKSASNNLDKQYCRKESKECVDSEVYVQEMNRALIDSGLPISFGKKQANIKKYEPMANNNMKKSINLQKLSKNESKSKYETKIKCNQAKNNGYSRSLRKDSDVSENEIYNEDRYNIQPCTSKPIRMKATKMLSAHSNHYSLFNSPGMNMYANFTQKYALWHSQLKTHIKHVEMVLYMEEMSKIK